jgi:hypothetical protein
LSSGMAFLITRTNSVETVLIVVRGRCNTAGIRWRLPSHVSWWDRTPRIPPTDAGCRYCD